MAIPSSFSKSLLWCIFISYLCNLMCCRDIWLILFGTDTIDLRLVLLLQAFVSKTWNDSHALNKSRRPLTPCQWHEGDQGTRMQGFFTRLQPCFLPLFFILCGRQKALTLEAPEDNLQVRAGYWCWFSGNLGRRINAAHHLDRRGITCDADLSAST